MIRIMIEERIVIPYDFDILFLGGELFLSDAEELSAVVVVALAGEMDAVTAKRTILAHPTFSESLEK